MADFLEITFSVLGGGAGVKIFDYVTQLRRNGADIRKIETETDGLVIQHWKALYDELKKVQLEQSLRMSQMEVEIEKLRIENINLKQTKLFNESEL